MLTLGPIPEEVRRAVQRLIAETDAAERTEGDERRSGLFLAGSPGGCSYLDAAGEVWDWSPWDESIEVVPDGMIKVSIVALAAKRIPELQAWLPARPSNALNCEPCRGSGWLPPPLTRLQCPECLGLGWVFHPRHAVDRATGISEGRAVRLRRTQFTLRRLMLAVAVAGLVFGCLAWLLPSRPLDFHPHDTYIKLGPYDFTSDSPAFWAILFLVLALLVGLLVGLIAVIVRTAKAIRNRFMRKA